MDGSYEDKELSDLAAFWVGQISREAIGNPALHDNYKVFPTKVSRSETRKQKVAVLHFGLTASPAGQLVSPTRLRFSSENRTGSLPGMIRSPTSCHTPSLMTDV